MQSPDTPTPSDWNVVVTAFSEGFPPALRALKRHGRAKPSGHYNVILMTVDDPMALLEALEAQALDEPVLIDSISRIAPALVTLEYGGDEDFERQALAAALPWATRLAGKSFHVRVHPRGAGLSAKSHELEARLGQALLDALQREGASATIDFDDPDLVLTLDVIDGRAGLGLWTREEMRAHRFLRPD